MNLTPKAALQAGLKLERDAAIKRFLEAAAPQRQGREELLARPGTAGQLAVGSLDLDIATGNSTMSRIIQSGNDPSPIQR